MKLYIFYDLDNFINNLDDDKIGNFDQYNIFKTKKRGHIFTFCDLHFVFSRKFYKIKNDDYHFLDFINQNTYNLKRIKNIKNPALKLKKQVLLKMYKIAKKDCGLKKQKIRVAFMTYQEYCEVADKFFSKDTVLKEYSKLKKRILNP